MPFMIERFHGSPFGKIWSLFHQGDDTEQFWEELEELLLSADTGIKATEHLLAKLRAIAKESRSKNSRELFQHFKLEIARFMGENQEPLRRAAGKPTVILAVGVNGTGKTTTIGKLAERFRKEGKKVFLAAADTFRAAAVEQLEIWAARTGATLIKHQEGANPAAVAFDALKACMGREGDLVIIDTAGRLHTKGNLMEELKKIQRVIRKEIPDAPHETLLILDATMGQNALNQARGFLEAVDVTGIVVTKLDGSAKAGFLIAIRQELNLPVKFIGTGETSNDLEEFSPAQFVETLLIIRDTSHK